jgi:hypothetical protein
MEIDPSIPSDEYIFNRRYMCMVNQMDTTSKEYIKLFGTPTTGNVAIDREMANQWITTFKTIAEMAELFKDSKVVRVIKQDDCETIYNSVEYHLKRWAELSKTSLNTGSAPIDDLMLLDRFATAIYPHALENTSKRKIIDNMFEKEINTVFINFDNIFGKPIDEAPQEKDEDGNIKLPQRQSYANAFINRQKWR